MGPAWGAPLLGRKKATGCVSPWRGINVRRNLRFANRAQAHVQIMQANNGELAGVFHSCASLCKDVSTVSRF
jgi:hypothetical protein